VDAIEAKIEEKYCPINYVKTYLIRNDKEAQSKCDDLIAQGYEGMILRNLDAPYQFGKRTVNMLKLKRLIHEEFEITGISLQENDNELGLYNCITKDGVEFKVTPTEDEEYKRLIVLMPHLVVNKLLTCAFYEYTDKNIPFHIVHNIVRDYENNTINKCF
jgi:ATP-dependent DNA ligase